MTLAGQQLGHYQLLRLIGKGGMGEVYLAQDTRLPRRVAVKVIHCDHQPYPDAKTSQQAERLFQREMKALSLLDHPHILNFYDFNEEQTAQGSLIYMVMPYRPEGSLVDWLLRHGSLLLPLQDVSALITQAASVLQHAHDQQIVHQDVKPSNFLVRINPDTPTHPDLFLVDFGIAKIFSATSLTNQSVRGTAVYMAPEQWCSEPVAATDQYALAIMAYQLLTGQLPFQGRTQQIMYQHLTVSPSPPSQYNAQLTAAIDAVILRALAKKAEERFPTIKAFALALQQALVYSDLHATLEISSLEAEQGGQHVVTLADQRQVTVTIPPNVQHGQCLQLKDLGMPYYEHGPCGPLLLTLHIVQAQASTTPSKSNVADLLPTTSDVDIRFSALTTPFMPAPALEPLMLSGAVPAAFAAPTIYARNTIYARMQLLTPQTLLLSLIVLLLIINSFVVGSVISNIAANNIHATATAQTIANNNATVQAIITHNNTTATAVARATAASLAANAQPYQILGTLVWVDRLNKANKWHKGSNTDWGGRCQFVHGTFQITQSPTDKLFPCNERTKYSNFVFEVKMRINQGDCGGLTIRDSNDSSGRDYLLEVCQDGYYRFYKYTSNNHSMALKSGKAPAINRGTGQLNVIAVVANGSNFDMYINAQKIDTATDSAYSRGTLGLLASASAKLTTVAYQDARLWMI